MEHYFSVKKSNDLTQSNRDESWIIGRYQFIWNRFICFLKFSIQYQNVSRKKTAIRLHPLLFCSNVVALRGNFCFEPINWNLFLWKTNRIVRNSQKQTTKTFDSGIFICFFQTFFFLGSTTKFFGFKMDSKMKTIT